MKVCFVLLFLMLLILPNKFHAQSTVFDTRHETNKSFVSVPVTVSDREGRYIPGLKKEDFSVYQNGVIQKITFFSSFKEQLNITLMLDTSKSSRDVIDKIKNAAKDFVDSLNPNDKCQVATFDSQVKIINSLTSNKKVIKESLDNVKINNYGGTLMYNAVNQITKESFKDVNGRKVIILLTDGNDFGSSLTKTEFLSSLEESDILVYTIFFNTGKNFNKSANQAGKSKKEKKAKKPRKNKKENLNKNSIIYVPTEEEIELLERNDEIEAIDSLKRMSDITAGRFYLSNIPDLDKTFKNIVGELGQQYRLGYDSKNVADGAAIQNIIVKVDRPDVVIRTRAVFRTKKS
jgi:Ca-activated chloride channel homolog